LGQDLLDNRLNVTVAGSFSHGDGLKFGDRDFTRGKRQANAGLENQNPARRFQQGDITSATPNFQQRFSIAAGRFPYGFAIPTAAQFATQFRA
jgi:hypothetical protein